jgi:O-antigen ligase
MIYGLGLVAMVVAWLLPGHYLPWVSFQQEALAAAGALALMLGAMLALPKQPLSLRPAFAAPLALAAVPLLQWSAGLVPFAADAVLAAAYLAAFAVLALVSHGIARSPLHARIEWLHWAILVGALMSSGVAVYQWLPLDRNGLVEYLPAGQRLYANFTQPNNFAVLLAMGLVSTIWFYSRRLIGVATLVLVLTLFAFCMAGTQSRAGWLIVVVIAAWVWAGALRATLPVPKAAILVTLFLFFVINSLWIPLNEALDPGVGVGPMDRTGGAGTRPIHWAVLWDAAWRSPWFGYGWLQVPRAQLAAVLDHPPAHEWLTYSHNGVLDLMVWCGIPLALVTVGAIGWWLFTRARRCRDIDAWALVALMLVVLTHATVEFSYAYFFFLAPAAIAFGAVEARTARSPPRFGMRISKWALGAPLAAGAALLALVVTEYLTLEEEGRRARFFEAGYSFDGKAPVVPDVILLDSQRELLWFRLTQARPGMDAQSLDRMRVVAHRFAPPAVLIRYALAAGLNGRPDDAARFLRYICHTGTQANCKQGSEAWHVAQERYPGLSSIAFPVAAASDGSSTTR